MHLSRLAEFELPTSPEGPDMMPYMGMLQGTCIKVAKPTCNIKQFLYGSPYNISEALTTNIDYLEMPDAQLMARRTGIKVGPSWDVTCRSPKHTLCLRCRCKLVGKLVRTRTDCRKLLQLPWESAVCNARTSNGRVTRIYCSDSLVYLQAPKP